MACDAVLLNHAANDEGLNDFVIDALFLPLDFLGGYFLAVEFQLTSLLSGISTLFSRKLVDIKVQHNKTIANLIMGP